MTDNDIGQCIFIYSVLIHRPNWTGQIMFAMYSEVHKYNGIWSNKRFRKIKDIARPGNQCSATRDKKYN